VCLCCRGDETETSVEAQEAAYHFSNLLPAASCRHAFAGRPGQQVVRATQMNYFWEAGGVAGFAGAGVEGVADVAAGAVAGVEAAGGVVVVGAAGGVVGA